QPCRFDCGKDYDVFYCKPAPDGLPSAEACLITGITPQRCEAEGVSEAEFAARIHSRFARPGTVSLGYNSLHFDDEVTRFLFWRTLNDPYGREWRDGCSRWDIYPLALAYFALRPEGIVWPEADPKPGDDPQARRHTFRLEKLSEANRLEHLHAHDAASDVEATIGLARLMASAQPRLWRWAFENRGKAKVKAALESRKPCLWIDPYAGQARGFIRLVGLVELAGNDAYVWDLAEDPGALAGLSAEDIRARTYASKEEAEAAGGRLGLHRIKVNAMPFVCNALGVLSPERRARFGVDLEAARARHARLLELAPRVRAVVAEAMAGRGFDDGEGGPDADEALYAGEIPKEGRLMAEAQRLAKDPRLLAERCAGGRLHFEDGRLNELLFRMRARCWPETLSEAERERWREHCAGRVLPGLEAYFEELERLQAAADEAREKEEITEEAWERRQEVLGDLYDWAERLQAFAAGE
ncbi:MAG: exodeoxyribonuclease I, partial [Duodenibacillus sp.]|nr:exodeoxyribonuclease I [Duodenibacillus sp.]